METRTSTGYNDKGVYTKRTYQFTEYKKDHKGA